MTNRRSALVAGSCFAILASVVAGCGSSGSASSSGQTRTVQIDGSTKAFNAMFMAYFPKVVSVHPGDTVVFQEHWTGEPHSVTMGTLVDKGLTAAANSDPNGPPPPAYASLPSMLPRGPGDAIQAAAAPCYLATGAPPSQPSQGCPKVAQPAFDGTWGYYSSGAIKPNKTWTVHLSKDIKPGTYQYYCNLHGAMMSGSIQVVSPSQRVPSQAAVTAAGNKERQAAVDKMMPTYQAVKAGRAPIKGNLAGVLSPDTQDVAVSEFVPNVIHAKVGQPVTWTLLGVHTVTVGGPATVPPALTWAPDGSVHLQASLFMPVGGPGEPQSSGSSGPPASNQIKVVAAVDGGSYNGTGERSSGIFTNSFPPALESYSLTFSKPGTYDIDCLFHPHMEAKVIVTP
ncbi:MAG: hypothetical protein ACR2KC_04730 [Acidimicrobiales bacterium]